MRATLSRRQFFAFFAGSALIAFSQTPVAFEAGSLKPASPQPEGQTNSRMDWNRQRQHEVAKDEKRGQKRELLRWQRKHEWKKPPERRSDEEKLQETAARPLK